MGALRLLRAVRNAAPGSGRRSPNLTCDPLLQCGELFHPRDTRSPLPAALVPSAGRRCPAAASHHS